MAAVIFPQENATNPDTGRPYNEGWLNPDNNIVYVYENGAWKAATTGESNAVLDSRYVEVDGDNMTGPLTLGGDKITLNPTDGKATFTGRVNVDSYIQSPLFLAGGSEYPSSNASIQLRKNTGSQAFYVDENIFQFGGSQPSSPNIQLNNDGSATFAGNTTVGGNPTANQIGCIVAQDGGFLARKANASDPIWYGYQVGVTDPTSNIYADGSADFAGGLTCVYNVAKVSGYGSAYLAGSSTFGLGVLDEDDVEMAKIGWDGSAEFASGDIKFRVDGSAEFAKTITSGPTTVTSGINYLTLGGNFTVGTVTDNAFAIYRSDNTLYASIKNNGVASFSTITADASGGQVTSEYNLVTKTRSPNLGLFLGSTDPNDAKASNSAASITSQGTGTFAQEVVAGVRDTNGVFMTASGAIESFVSGGRVYSLSPTGVITADSTITGGTSAGSSGVSYGLQGYANATAGNGSSVYARNYASGGYNWFGAFGSSGAVTSYITEGGNAYFAGTVNGTTVGTSDIKFKENITAANPQLDDVVALGNSLKNFDWKDNAPLSADQRSKRFLGLIAQEAEAICPGLITEVLGDGEEPETYKTINHDILVMKLLGAVAEQQVTIESLEARIDQLISDQ